jgi:beta-glucosidase
MSLEEKVNLMGGQVDLDNLMQDFFAPSKERHYNWYPYPAGGNERLGVPKLKFCDGPRGVVCKQSTCFPVTMGRGATFDTELEERIGEAVGKEIRAHGGNYYGGVCINLPYNPGWGRSQEVYGEESFHLGKMGSALVQGVQKENVIACAKHFAFNSMENARFKVSVEADERTEREVFLPHFKDCVDAGAASVMSSYNRFKGIQCGHSYHLLSQVLKKEWDFDGFVVSDFCWGVKDTVEAANGGQDVEMCNTEFFGDKLVKAVKDGWVKEEVIDQAALRIVRTLLAFSETEDPQEYTEDLIACKEHIALAKEAAEKSMTLIQNKNGVLPFSKKKVKKLALIGKLVNIENIGDHGSSRVFPPYAVTPYQGLSKLLTECEISVYDGENADEAAKVAASADAVVIVTGCNHDDEGEFVADTDEAASVGGDRKKTLGLTFADIELIKKVGASNSNTAVVLIGGNMIMIDEWKDCVPAILMAYYPGMEGGTAIAATLFGDVNPGGKLPFVIPKKESDLPQVDWEAEEITYNYYHGYAKLEKEGIEPSVPYGFGLSYTTFEVSDPSLNTYNDRVNVSCFVKNTGKIAGDEVVQFYAGFRNSAVDRPVKLLRGFKRVTLEAGQTKQVTMSCPIEKLKWYNPAKGCWELEHMEYEAYVGTSSDEKDLQKLVFNL